MISLLIAIIYLAFVSLGLPDSLLGTAWPVMHVEIGAPLSFAGIVTMTIAGCTIVSSLLSPRMVRWLGIGKTTAISVLMTAIALFGFSTSSHFFSLLLWALPYGFGAGAVDVCLNNYVALNYSSRHMNWLHCFWGVGAAISPYIMSFALISERGWSAGYKYVAFIQIVIAVIMFAALPLWKRAALNEVVSKSSQNTKKTSHLTYFSVIQNKGVISSLLTILSYCALETTAGLWASTYFVAFRGVPPQQAAGFAGTYFIGITIGRFICGLLSNRIGDKRMVRYSLGVLLLGICLLLVPTSAVPAAVLEASMGIIELPVVALFIVGLGSAAIFPSVIHSTPVLFGEDKSQMIISLQMACAYTGSTVMPFLFGIVAQNMGVGLYPVYLLFFSVLMLVASEQVNRITGRKQ